jgi:hypothetical protein
MMRKSATRSKTKKRSLRQDLLEISQRVNHLQIANGEKERKVNERMAEIKAVDKVEGYFENIKRLSTQFHMGDVKMFVFVLFICFILFIVV